MTWLYAHTFITKNGQDTFEFVMCVFLAVYTLQYLWRYGKRGGPRRRR